MNGQRIRIAIAIATANHGNDEANEKEEAKVVLVATIANLGGVLGIGIAQGLFVPAPSLYFQYQYLVAQSLEHVAKASTNNKLVPEGIGNEEGSGSGDKRMQNDATAGIQHLPGSGGTP